MRGLALLALLLQQLQDFSADAATRQIELWRIERADQYTQYCLDGHTEDRCHAIPNTI